VNVSKDFEELFACFARHGVRALVVGAHAVAFHAKPRYTKDLDLLVEPERGNAERILLALADFGFGSLRLTADDFCTPGTVVQLGYPPNRVDLLTAISGVSFEQAWNGRVEGRYGAQTAWFIGKAELIVNKQAAARPQDLLDVEWLRG
jgi:hypothetical protein